MKEHLASISSETNDFDQERLFQERCADITPAQQSLSQQMKTLGFNPKTQTPSGRS